MRRAQLTVPVTGKPPMKLDAHLWKDSSMVGIVNTAHVGKSEGHTTRQVGKSKVKIPSFLAQRKHAFAYGGVDRIGKGAKEYGVAFSVVPWHRHIVTGIENISSHATWVLAQYDMEVTSDPDMISLLKQHKASKSEKGAISSNKGCTHKRHFMLAMTRDVIKRSRERIKASHGKSLSPRRRSSRNVNSASPKRPRGQPAKHKWSATLSKKSRGCQGCYAIVAKINKGRPKRDRLTRDQLMKGPLGDVRYCTSGCRTCGKRVCQQCWPTWSSEHVQCNVK